MITTSSTTRFPTNFGFICIYYLRFISDYRTSILLLLFLLPFELSPSKYCYNCYWGKKRNSFFYILCIRMKSITAKRKEREKERGKKEWGGEQGEKGTDRWEREREREGWGGGGVGRGVGREGTEVCVCLRVCTRAWMRVPARKCTCWRQCADLFSCRF